MEQQDVESENAQSFDVAIIGTGLSGASSAYWLSELGNKCLSIEVGQRHEELKKVRRFRLAPGSDVYRGHSAGRRFGIGGTTSVWGGQLIVPAPEIIDGFCLQHGISINQFRQASQAVLALFSFDGSYQDFELREEQCQGLDVRTSWWIPHSKRNVSWLLGKAKSKHGLSVSSDSEIVDIKKTADGICVSYLNEAHEIKLAFVKKILFCSGSFENEIFRFRFNKQRHAKFVRNFFDHVSSKCAEIKVTNSVGFSKKCAPFFRNGSIRTRRYEIAGGQFYNYAYGHFGIEFSDQSFLGSARMFLLSFQKKYYLKGIKYLFSCLWFLDEALFLVYFRLIHNCLFISSKHKVWFIIDLSGCSAEGSLEISENDGLINAHIDWSEPDPLVFEQVYETFKEKLLNGSSLFKFIKLDNAERNIFDIFHPFGFFQRNQESNRSIPSSRSSESFYFLSPAEIKEVGSANPGFLQLVLGFLVVRQIHERLR